MKTQKTLLVPNEATFEYLAEQSKRHMEAESDALYSVIADIKAGGMPYALYRPIEAAALAYMTRALEVGFAIGCEVAAGDWRKITLTGDAHKA